jgi:GGDEF domain-containing protein
MLFAVANRIIARVSEPIPFDGAEARVSASVGIVRAGDMVNPDPARILAAADRALYAAKHAGRSRAVLLPAPLD